MAGPTAYRKDPAMEKYNDYMKNRWKYFRWTPRSGFIAFMYAGVVPGALAYLFYRTDGKYYMRGKLRGDPIKEW